MKYPIPEHYIIQFRPGTCGSFINAMISSSCYDRDYTFNFSKFGNAHYISRTRNFIKQNISTIPEDPDWLNVVALNPLLPVIIGTHSDFTYKHIAEKFTKVKILRIEASFPDDYILIHANRFFKCTVDSGYWLKEHWKEDAKMFFNNAETPHDKSITDDMIFNLVQYKSKQVEVFKHTFPDNQHQILPFRKIYNSKKEVLEIISELINRPVTRYQETLYDRYLQAQDSIINFLAKYNYTV